MITRKLKHVTYIIDQDPDPWNPRSDFDYLTTIALTNNRYLSGDETLNDSMIELITNNKDTEYLPIYAYIHSGIALSNSPFSCPWDSGQIGYIFIDKEKVQKEFNCIQWRKKAKQVLQSEFNEFKLYIEGDCYLVTVKDNYTSDILDTCSYIDTIDHVKKEAESIAAACNTTQAETYNRLITEVS